MNAAENHANVVTPFTNPSSEYWKTVTTAQTTTARPLSGNDILSSNFFDMPFGHEAYGAEIGGGHGKLRWKSRRGDRKRRFYP